MPLERSATMDPENSWLIMPSWPSFGDMSPNIFFNVKNWPIFADFESFLPSNSMLLIFGIELMIPKDSQILVDDFRHQNFVIWTFLA